MSSKSSTDTSPTLTNSVIKNVEEPRCSAAPAFHSEAENAAASSLAHLAVSSTAPSRRVLTWLDESEVPAAPPASPAAPTEEEDAIALMKLNIKMKRLFDAFDLKIVSLRGLPLRKRITKIRRHMKIIRKCYFARRRLLNAARRRAQDAFNRIETQRLLDRAKSCEEKTALLKLENEKLMKQRDELRAELAARQIRFKERAEKLVVLQNQLAIQSKQDKSELE